LIAGGSVADSFPAASAGSGVDWSLRMVTSRCVVPEGQAVAWKLTPPPASTHLKMDWATPEQGSMPTITTANVAKQSRAMKSPLKRQTYHATDTT